MSKTIFAATNQKFSIHYMKTNPELTLSEKEMRDYGYKVVDAIVEHYQTINSKSPVFNATREQMDAQFLENAPEEGSDKNDVLNFVVNKVLKETDILSHPKMYSFVPGPSNYISAMADTLATGFNINFFTLFSEFDPHIYIGGDNVIFWGPLAWTVIYGLFIATFLTLIVVPILFYLITRFKMWLKRNTTSSDEVAVQ